MWIGSDTFHPEADVPALSLRLRAADSFVTITHKRRTDRFHVMPTETTAIYDALVINDEASSGSERHVVLEVDADDK